MMIVGLQSMVAQQKCCFPVNFIIWNVHNPSSTDTNIKPLSIFLRDLRLQLTSDVQLASLPLQKSNHYLRTFLTGVRQPVQHVDVNYHAKHGYKPSERVTSSMKKLSYPGGAPLTLPK